MKKLITLSLLAIAVGMTASISADEKPCCMDNRPCCQDTASCCSDADTLTLHMEHNGNPQL